MRTTTQQLTLVVFVLALAMAAFFAFAVVRFVNDAPPDRRTAIAPTVPVGAELSALLSAERSGTVTHVFADIDGDTRLELLLGYEVDTSTGRRPEMRVAEQTDEGWYVASSFTFPVLEPYGNAEEWRTLHGMPSFVATDIDNDESKELIVRFVGAEGVETIGIVDWRNDRLVWLPMTDFARRPRLPLFREWNTDGAAEQFSLEGVSENTALALVVAHGVYEDMLARLAWEYEVYVSRSGVYTYDAVRSNKLTASGRRPGQ